LILKSNEEPPTPASTPTGVNAVLILIFGVNPVGLCIRYAANKQKKMNEQRIKFLILYAIAIASAVLLRKATDKIAKKAIEEKRLSTGIYRIYPIEGEQAVRLAKGYISGSKIVLWFVILIFPFMFYLLLQFNAI